MEKDSFTIAGYEVIDRKVKKAGSGGRVYVPVSWDGADVKVVRTSEPKAKITGDEEEEE